MKWGCGKALRLLRGLSIPKSVFPGEQIPLGLGQPMLGSRVSKWREPGGNGYDGEGEKWQSGQNGLEAGGKEFVHVQDSSFLQYEWRTNVSQVSRGGVLVGPKSPACELHEGRDFVLFML